MDAIFGVSYVPMLTFLIFNFLVIPRHSRVGAATAQDPSDSGILMFLGSSSSSMVKL